MSLSARQEVVAIVVTYQPSIELLRRSLAACLDQVAQIILVDNGSPRPQREALQALAEAENCTLLALPDNLGIASAQNRGIALARQTGANYVLLLDQDSVPLPDMVAKLLTALQQATDAGQHVAAVGPRLLDRRSGSSTPFVRIGLLGVRRLVCAIGQGQYLQSDFLIASGALIPLAVLDAVGTMEEGLFIDNVDLEWCFRARAQGYTLLGICDAVLEHSVGEPGGGGGGGTVYRHGPLRQYYIMRNRILLYRRSYSPFGWIMQDFARMLVKVLLFSLIFPPRRKNLRMIALGLVDGIRGRCGPYRHTPQN